MQPLQLPDALAKVDQLVDNLRFSPIHGLTPRLPLPQRKLTTAGLTQVHRHLTTPLFKD
jgi:hypothetical protein